MADMCSIRKRILYIITVFIFFMAAGLINSSNADASSASVDITTSKNNVVKGDTVYVIITITSNDEIGGFKGYFSYDNSVLRYVTGGTVASGNDDEFLITDTDREEASGRLKYSVKFIARASGNTTLMLKQPYAVYSYGSNAEEEMSVSYSPLNIVVSPKKKPVQVTKKPASTKKPEATRKPEVTPSPVPVDSGSAKLESLGIKNIMLSPAFSPDTYKYSGTVETEDTSLDILYETEDMDADVTVKGNGGLSEGKNTIKVIVKSPSGSRSVYKLLITVKRQERLTGLGNIKTILRDGGVVLKTNDEYTVEEIPDSSLIPEGFGKTEMKLGDRVVKVCSSENDTEHKFVLLYCRKKGKKPEFYLYDKEEQSLMPYAKVQSWYRGNNGNTVVAEEQDAGTEIQKLEYMLAIAVIICLLLVIIIISVYMHFKGMDKDDLSEILK